MCRSLSKEQKIKGGLKHAKPLEYHLNVILINSDKFRNGVRLRDSLLKCGFIKDFSCQDCGWAEVNPYTGNIPTEVHHKDGIRTNNHPSNLRVLCPNCHCMTSTHCGANVANLKSFSK